MKRLSVFVLFALSTTMALAPPAWAQDTNVILPGGSIDATERSDEPGTAQKLVAVGDSLTDVLAVQATTSLTAPADGYVLAMASGTIIIDCGVSQGIPPCGPNEVIFAVTDDCDATPTEHLQEVRISIPPIPESGIGVFPMSTQRVYPVIAGAMTFCIVGGLEVPSDVPLVLSTKNLSLSVMYLPTAYGMVDE